MLNLTPVVRNIIIINVLVFILQNLFSAMQVTEILSLWNVRTENFRPYQLFTYMFAHGGFGHLFFNMLSLAFTAPILENYWGPKRFLLFYIVTGIGAGIFNIAIDYFVLSGASFGLMMGASGAVYGVLMGFGMMFPNMEIQLLIPPIPIKAKYLVFVLGGISFFLDRSGSVAHLAHLGGIVFAFFMIQYWRSQGGRGGFF
jgi:membrane associated rhomboid family serine protease